MSFLLLPVNVMHSFHFRSSRKAWQDGAARRSWWVQMLELSGTKVVSVWFTDEISYFTFLVHTYILHMHIFLNKRMEAVIYSTFITQRSSKHHSDLRVLTLILFKHSRRIFKVFVIVADKNAATFCCYYFLYVITSYNIRTHVPCSVRMTFIWFCANSCDRQIRKS